MRSPLLRRPRHLAALAALPAVAACGGQVISAGDVTVLVAARSTSGMDALGVGPLEVVGGCLGIAGYVVVWPHGTEVAAGDPLTIEIPDNGTFALGDQVQVAGGFVLEHASSDEVDRGPFRAGGVDVPDACAEHDVFLARPGR